MASQSHTAAATVDTDQMDYQPDTTATITGSGFWTNEPVELQVLNLTTPADVGAEHDPWTINADTNGDFQTTWYVTSDELGQTLELTATGLTSGLVAQRVFTDSATVTPANASISVDTAADAVAPAWTTLGKIKVAENNKADFSAGTNVTLVLKAPSGWQFNTAATPSTTFSGPEITAASTAVSDTSTLIVTVTVTDNKKYQDIFTIYGVQIRPTTGNPLSTGLQIYRPTTGGGTLLINGITTSTDGSSGTSFGLLTETHGVFAGYSISGTNFMTAGASKNLTIQKTDQSGNAVNDGTTKTLTFSGLGSAGTNNPKINGAITAFSSGVSVAFNSSGLATTTLSLIPYKVENAILNVTDGTKTSAAVSGGLALTISAAASSKLAFTSSAVTVAAGVASGSITVQRQDQFGNPVTAEGTRTVTLSSSSTGTVTFVPASLAIASGSSSADFTYTDTKAGTPTITAASTAPGAITPATQSETVIKASTSMTVSSSKNPAGFKDSVNFTATLSATATGSVRFLTNGVVFNTISLTGGVAISSATTLLPRGTNAITAQYAGDSNYWGSTNSIDQVVTNHPPIVGAINYTRTAGLKLRIFWADIVTNWSDADGDLVTLAGFNLVTTNHVNLLTNDLQILYPSSQNVNDRITYTITDGQGSTNTGIINVVVNPFVTGQQTLATLTLSNNTITTTFHGIPDYIYEVQRSTNFSGGSGWVDIATNTVGANGMIQVTDTFPDLGGQTPASAYYRLKWNP